MKPILVNLSADERLYLDKIVRTGSASARVIARARILLLADRSQGQSRSDDEVAEAVMVHAQTVYNVRRRYAREGLDAAIYDKPCPGAIPKVTGDVEAKLVVLACSEPPEGHDRWTLKLLADRLVELEIIESVSPVTVHRRLKKRSKTVAGKLLVYRQTKRFLCRQDGGRARCIPASL